MLHARALCIACVLRSAEALQGAGTLSTPRPPLLLRSVRPQAVLEHLQMLPETTTLLEHASSLLEHGPSLAVAAVPSSREVAEILRDGSIIIVPESQFGLLQGAEKLQTEVRWLSSSLSLTRTISTLHSPSPSLTPTPTPSQALAKP